MNTKIEQICKQLERFEGVHVVSWGRNESTGYLIEMTVRRPQKESTVTMRLAVEGEGVTRICGICVPDVGKAPAEVDVESFTVRLNRGTTLVGKFLPYNQDEVYYQALQFIFDQNPSTKLLGRLITDAMAASEGFLRVVVKRKSRNN